MPSQANSSNEKVNLLISQKSSNSNLNRNTPAFNSLATEHNDVAHSLAPSDDLVASINELMKNFNSYS